MLLRSLLKVAGTLLLCLAVAATASAQYGGPGGGTGMGGTGSSGGYSSGSGKAIGIGVGVAAGAAVGIALLVHHRHAAARKEAAVIGGCTQSFMNGLGLLDENDNHMYLLLSKNTSLQPGELVELKGVVAKEGSGTPAFRVQSLVKNYGTCGTAAALRDASAPENNQTVLAAK
jgi:hypothetical protein